MTDADLTQRARDEAERRWPDASAVEQDYRHGARNGFALGAEWAAESLTAEVERACQALWDGYAVLGFDTDGDHTPGAMVAGMGLDGFLASMVRAFTEARRDADEGERELVAERDALAARHDRLQAAVEGLARTAEQNGVPGWAADLRALLAEDDPC